MLILPSMLLMFTVVTVVSLGLGVGIVRACRTSLNFWRGTSLPTYTGKLVLSYKLWRARGSLPAGWLSGVEVSMLRPGTFEQNEQEVLASAQPKSHRECKQAGQKMVMYSASH